MRVSVYLFGILFSSAFLFMQIAVAIELQVPQQYQTIQAAIDAAKAGDVVLVEPGTYREHLVLIPKITLRSVGDDTKGKLGLLRAEKTILDGGKKQKETSGVQMAEEAMIDGFTVANYGLYDEKLWQHHFDTQGEQQPYEHIGKPGVAGISILGINCKVKNNIVHHNGTTGIAIIGKPDKPCQPQIENNVCYRNMGGGIGSMKNSQATIIKNICFENYFAGIGHSGASPKVLKNTCYRNVRAGIGISEGSSPVVKENICYQNRRAGIGVRLGKNTKPQIINNDCYENAMAGIGCREESAPLIQGNRCYRNTLAGIGARTGASPRIIENECYENGKAGIGQMSGTETVIIGNYLHHNLTAGIGYEEGEAGNSLVKDNRIIENKLVAVGIHQGWNVKLENNVLSRKTGLPPIIMLFAGSKLLCENNIIQGGGVAGIRVAGDLLAINNQFQGVSLRKVGPPNFAVWALPGSKVILQNNKINTWRHALHATDGQVTVTGNTVRDFHRVAFVIQKPKTNPEISKNKVMAKDQADQICLIDGKPEKVEENELIQEKD